ncbi:MAG: arsenate reductase/protein-tyrosine-phosphatase family protein [Promethearchaeota archaeon]
MNPLKNAMDIGIVCIDNTKLSPVAAVLLRSYALQSNNSKVRDIQFYDAGYNREVADSAKGFLQQQGFGTTYMLESKRIDKKWIKSKDIILTMDRFLKRDIIYDYPLVHQDLKEKVFTLTEVAGIQERIRDPGEDYEEDLESVFLLIDKCCKGIIKKLEKAN